MSATMDESMVDAPISYSIVRGNTDSAFSIDRNGVLSTLAELDREIVDNYQLAIVAVAGSEPQSRAETTVRINGSRLLILALVHRNRPIVSITNLVLDTNDNVPTWPPSKNITLSEG